MKFLEAMSFPGPASLNKSKRVIAEGRYDKLKTVFLFGLVQGSRKNPFEMIDERIDFKPPTYSAAKPPGYS